jgi:hypothetical protein
MCGEGDVECWGVNVGEYRIMYKDFGLKNIPHANYFIANQAFNKIFFPNIYHSKQNKISNYAEI